MTETVRFHAFGGPEVLQYEDLPVGEPGPGEVRLRMQAIGLNRAEAAFRSGRYIEQARLPSRLGYEGVGVIEAMGAQVHGWAVGQSVCVLPTFSMNDYGVYARAAIVPAHALAPRPAGLDSAACAALWMAALTAYGGLIDIGRVGCGDAVLITAASSSVGLAAIEIARHVGAVPIAVTRAAGKRDALLAAGAAEVLVAGGEPIDQAVLRVTGGKGVRLVFDPVSGPGLATLAAALAPQGQLVVYGNLSGQGDKAPFPQRVAVARGLSMRGYLVFEILRDVTRRAAAQAFIEAALRDGALHPHVDRRFRFEEIVEAHRHLESNEQVGKVVVQVADSSLPT